MNTKNKSKKGMYGMSLFSLSLTKPLPINVYWTINLKQIKANGIFQSIRNRLKTARIQKSKLKR